ncbi:MAG TPA: alpha/beta fold hydrolase [Pyrinomonadaceae bacterium]|jgi:phospholipase/carboxylesterase|nr:alpha/beta fold hydrolase [Pyrinomonadaceae bacterium]
MAKDLSLTHLVREPSARTAGEPPPLLVLLHGIGSNEADLFSLAPYLDGRFLVASARAPVVIASGAFGWFNIEYTPAGLVADVAQARASLRQLAVFVGELVDAYSADPRRVYLMGFSQGAMMSLSLMLSQPGMVAGVVAMSGRLPTELLADLRDASALAGLPVLVTHGTFDQVLTIENGRAIRDALSELPVALTYREYPMAHEVSQESLRDVAAWLTRTLTASEGAGNAPGSWA